MLFLWALWRHCGQEECSCGYCPVCQRSGLDWLVLGPQPRTGEVSPMASSAHRLSGASVDPGCEPAPGWTEGGSVAQESGKRKLNLRGDRASAVLGQPLAQCLHCHRSTLLGDFTDAVEVSPWQARSLSILIFPICGNEKYIYPMCKHIDVLLVWKHCSLLWSLLLAGEFVSVSKGFTPLLPTKSCSQFC